ncbi:MAG TPA: hypothetical protein VLA68_07395 [Nitrososphaera sp.]|nr:hypothetical protein [Nitrososphaera sp.]
MEVPSQKKSKTFDGLVAAVNIATLGAAIASAAAAENKQGLASSDAARIEKRIGELSDRLDKVAYQLKNIQVRSRQQRGITPSGVEAEKRHGPAQHQEKPRQVIHVRKPSEYSFYS